MRIWTDIPEATLKRLHIDNMVHFKGGTKTVQSRTIPEQSALEAMLLGGSTAPATQNSGLLGDKGGSGGSSSGTPTQGSLADYAITGAKNAGSLLGQANSSIGNTYNPNYNALTGRFNDTMNNVTLGLENAANGVQPSAFATARQNALNTDLNGTIGASLNGLAERGVIGGSDFGRAINGITRNASDTLARNWTTDQNTYINTLNQQAQQANNTLTGNATAQQASYFTPQQLFAFANQNYAPAMNLFNTLYGGRMGTGSTTTTQSDGGSGVASAVGSLGSALILCFAGGTMIATPDGDKPIESMQFGDKVYSLDDENNICVETVTYVNPPHESPVWEVTTDKGIIKPTESQRFMTDNGFEYIEDIEDDILTIDGYATIEKKELKPAEIVYDFSTTGRNIFFANGLAAEGYD